MWSVWNELLSEQDRQVVVDAGYAEHGAASWDSRALGRRPALLVIDMQGLFVGPNLPVLQAVARTRTAVGERAWRCIPHIACLLTVAREAGWPVLFARVIPRGMSAADKLVQIVPELTPLSSEAVIDKAYSSAFFGTDLRSRLADADVDTLVLTGATTSGCVRATAVDACQHGLRPVIPVEAVFDRIEASHQISLLDLWMKYARVMSVAEVAAYLQESRKTAG